MKRLFGGYLVTVALPLAATVFMLTRLAGTAQPSPAGHGGPSQLLYRLLLATAVVVALAAAAGALARRFGQPRVIGEMATGLVLGPSVLGLIAPREQQWLFPPYIMPHLETLAQFGVVFFMFLVGAELAPRTLLASGARGLVIGHASIALPLLAGIGTGWWLYTTFPPARDPGVLPFVLFIGVCFAITAFPVLARILTDLRMVRTPLGTTGIATAGIGDVTAWCLLVAVVAIVRGTSPLSALTAVALVTVFAGFMLGAVRPVLARILERSEARAWPRFTVFAGLITLVLVAAVTTEQIGVHPIFGAFVAGLAMPRDSRAVTELTSKLEGVTLWFMLPIFFVAVGLSTKLDSLDSARQWLACALITAIAIAAKLLGTGSAALATGSPPREALALGVMMNCRGLTELVVLSLGLQLGILSTQLFAMFVIMALLTTAMTGPLLRLTTPEATPHDPGTGHDPGARRPRIGSHLHHSRSGG
ncbi:cation:proton antiporter [Allorhizocola rhizosphaerae]|uniref:cation:proton antiporter n=1 Tax=Allorhizocola rhizosphaerae TaxID=1872709 RepID=UPI000E3E6DCD|nr:cation:proton antiporter [Allorhizocola rhizosphaerae]